MSRSGVIVADECINAFNELKLGKKSKFVLFELNDAKTTIVVKKQSSSQDYDAFLSELNENEPLYAVYDFEYEVSEGGKRSKLVFFTWIPDTAPIRSKMVYASSKDALRTSFNGLSAEIQGTDFDEVAFETVLAIVSKGAGNH